MAQDVVSSLIPFVYWIRTNTETFFLNKMMEDLGVTLTEQSVAFLKRVIEYNHMAYTVGSELSDEWQARSVFCLSVSFAFTPTELEIENKIIVQGSRFDPYISNLANAMIPKIVYGNEFLEPCLISLPLSEIKRYYYLYSKDELMDHLSSVESNKDHNFSEDTDDDCCYYVPCFDMTNCYTDDVFGKDTKLVFKVEEFERKTIRFVKKTNKKLSKKYIEEWTEEFRNLFYESLGTHQVDCSTIADIVANTLFMGREGVLGKNFLLSPQEYLQEHDLLEDVRTGVKCARWVKDVPFCTYNFWFHYVLNFRYLVFRANADENFFASIYSPMTDSMLCFFVLEFAENNYLAVSQDDGECKGKCIKACINDFFNLERYKPYHKKIATIVGKKYKKYAKCYNPFNKSREVETAIAMVKVFRRMVLTVSHLQRMDVGPQDLPSDISIVLQQMAQDIDYAAKNVMNLIQKQNMPDKDKTTGAIRDLTEKFGLIMDETEQFVFSRYGRY